MRQARIGLEALIKVRDYCHDAHNTMHDLADEAASYVAIIHHSIPAHARNN